MSMFNDKGVKTHYLNDCTLLINKHELPRSSAKQMNKYLPKAFHSNSSVKCRGVGRKDGMKQRRWQVGV